MHKICNMSLQQGIFPQCLKTARIIPVYKSGEKSKVNNYRPISILCAFGKILEKIVSAQLESYLNENNILTANQFGYRRGVSTENAVQKLLSHVYEAFDKGEFVLNIFLDLSKAFDVVNRRYLLYKLKRYGVNENELSWFTSYLDDRHQFTCINGNSSTVLSVQRGVPQGSILGPLLFIVYINDICNSSDYFKFIMYADDTSLLVSSNNIVEMLSHSNVELRNVMNWFASNELIVNQGKTKFMIFTRKKQLPATIPEICVANSPIERIYSYKFLGVTLDVSLKFKQHVSEIARKISKFVPIIYRIRSFLNRKLLLQIYSGLIYPNLIYCITAWGSTNESVIKILQVAQNKIVRAICGADRFCRSDPLFSQLKMFNIRKVYQYMVCNYVHKSLAKSESQFSYQINNYNTRQAQNRLLTIPFTRSSHTMKSLSLSGPRNYNALPLTVKESKTFATFKKRLRDYMWLQYAS